MGRPPKFSTDELLDAAADLLVAGGPASLTASAVARTIGAPSGSVYHRFESRDVLAESLWMRTVERFHVEVAAGLEATGDPVEVAISVATKSVEWSSTHLVDAFILTMYRRTDLIANETTPDLARRAEELGAAQLAAMEALAERLDRPVDLVRFAVAGIPMAAIRRHLDDRSPVPAWVNAAVGRAVRATLDSDSESDEGDHQ